MLGRFPVQEVLPEQVRR